MSFFSVAAGARGSGLKAFPVILAGLFAAACGTAPVIPPADQPLAKSTLTLLATKGMAPEAPIFIRIFKEDSELEVWKARDDGRFYHFKTYPICNWSGELGPKLVQGDKQAPEGFYKVFNDQMNPNSQYHLAFNIGYPNVYDRAQKRTGQALMVHGQCTSSGCYAMTDLLMEEIYGLAREAFKGGQRSFDVHAFPFRMTDANMKRVRDNPWYPFWVTLKQGYDHFETHRLPPGIAVCERRYVVNVSYPGNKAISAERACPRFDRPMIEPFAPTPAEQKMVEERIVARGLKMRAAANAPEESAPEAAAVAAAEPKTSGGDGWFGLGALTSGSIGSALGFSQ